MHAYRRLLTLGALTGVGVAATTLLQGGWQAAAAGLAILAGMGFGLTFTVIRVLSERPLPRHPSWSQAPERLRGVPTVPTPHAAAAPATVSADVPSGGRQRLARPRPRAV